MKQNSTLLIALAWTTMTFALIAQKQDTIYANERMNTALFFPSEIRQGIVGAKNFAFTYNREKGQKLGLLKATAGEDSNLLVITVDGRIYSFILRYAEQLKSMNRFIKISESIGHETGMSADSEIKRDSVAGVGAYNPNVSTEIEKKDYLETKCERLMSLPHRKSILKTRQKITLGIKNIIYQDDLVFIQFEIGNKSGIDFKIGSLEVFNVIGNRNRKASYQERIHKPVFVYQMPKVVRYGENVGFVYVLPKFTLSNGETMLVQLKELEGSRSVPMKLNSL